MTAPVTRPARNAPVLATVALAVLGVILVVIGVIYFVDTASALPSLLPGHQAGSAHKHTKHGIVALVAGIVVFAAAWISSGTRRA